MDIINELIEQNVFIKTLFDSLPSGILVLDRERRIRALNHFLTEIFGISKSSVLGIKMGEFLHCINSAGDSKKCGSSEACEQCEGRKALLAALEENRRERTKATFQVLVNEKIVDVSFSIRVVPFECNGDRFAILIFEDISELMDYRKLLEKKGIARILGRHPKMLELFDTIREAAQSNVPVLIQGESGTGKELVALALHEESPRAERNFVAVHCAALPEGLLESELFGHVKGAFTGAIRNKKGRFELAHGGSIFLDEIAELSPAMQVKLLRVLDTGKFEQLGSLQLISVDSRVISATNRNLEEEVVAGRFRPDLYYRLCVIPIVVPPLRERQSDILPLADHFLLQAVRNSGRSNISFSQETIHILKNHSWPGNVRELRNVIEFGVLKCQGREIQPSHLPPALQRITESILRRKRKKQKLQESSVIEALKVTRGNKSKAAQILGVSRATFYRYLGSVPDSDSENPDP